MAKGERRGNSGERRQACVSNVSAETQDEAVGM